MSVTTETPTIEVDAPCEVVALEADSKDYILDARVRCDHSECNAQSYVQVTLKSDGTLCFCAHHAAKVAPSLKPLAKKWYTEEARLIENRKTGSEN